jgi:hypothetical protein
MRLFSSNPGARLPTYGQMSRKDRPDKVATAPISIKPWWLYPSAAVSTLLSLGFGLLGRHFVLGSNGISYLLDSHHAV